MGSTRIILSSAPSSGAVVAVGSPCFFDAAIFWAVLATSCPVCFTFLADCCARSPAVLPVCCALPAACCAASFTVLAVWERQKATCSGHLITSAFGPQSLIARERAPALLDATLAFFHLPFGLVACSTLAVSLRASCLFMHTFDTSLHRPCATTYP